MNNNNEWTGGKKFNSESGSGSDASSQSSGSSDGEYSDNEYKRRQMLEQAREQALSLESKDRSNTLLMRAKRPVYQNFTRTCVLNFEGRSVKSSKKNIQIEYKSRLDARTDRCRVAL